MVKGNEGQLPGRHINDKKIRINIIINLRCMIERRCASIQIVDCSLSLRDVHDPRCLLHSVLFFFSLISPVLPPGGNSFVRVNGGGWTMREQGRMKLNIFCLGKPIN